MIHFHNFKKLFLLLFLLIPNAGWAMKREKQKEKDYDFYVVLLTDKDKKKCRLLHQMIADRYFKPASNSTDNLGTDLQKLREIYQNLKLVSIFHSDFCVKRNSIRCIMEKKMSDHDACKLDYSSPNQYRGIREFSGVREFYPYEDVMIVYSSTFKATKQYIQGVCRQFPFKAKLIFGRTKLDTWHEEAYSQQYDLLNDNFNLVDFDDDVKDLQDAIEPSAEQKK